MDSIAQLNDFIIFAIISFKYATMKIIAHINTDTPEGQRILEELRKHPHVVSFEESHVNEPETAYETPKKTENNAPEGYVTLEEFRTKMHEFVRKQYAK